MQQGLGFIHVHAYNILSMPELVWKFNNVQHLQVEMVSIVCDVSPLNVWTDEGQACDYSASCSILRLFTCAHTITQLVWGFRYLDTSYLDKGRLIQKSIVCWDYVPEMGFVRGKR